MDNTKELKNQMDKMMKYFRKVNSLLELLIEDNRNIKEKILDLAKRTSELTKEVFSAR